MRSTPKTKWKCALLSLLAAAFVFTPGAARAQGADWWRQYKAQCRARGGTICEIYSDCNGVCTPRQTKAPGNAGNSQEDNGAAAEAEAAAQRQRDAEIEQQRIEENRRLEEAAKQAKFDQDKQEALHQLKGISESGDFNSGSGLKGVANSSNSLGLKTLPDVNTDTSVVDLRDTNLADANKALMRHQWAMTIDQRYKDDPQVQQYIRDLWDRASHKNTESESLNKIKSILIDQLKVSGLTQPQVDDFFDTFDKFVTGDGAAPKAWSRSSTLAHEIDDATLANEPPRPYYQTLVTKPAKAQGIKATVIYMGTGPQTSEDCVLHAISNGAQVPYEQVKARLEPTLKNLAIARSEVRKDPELAITSQKKGGVGGLNTFEEILIAKQVGNVIGVPDKNFAKAIESTGRPVITSVEIDAYNAEHELVRVGNHEVAVTGVYRTLDGKIFYSVMDSNLKTHPNYTAYVEKNDFENHMLFGGGYVVVPAEKH